MRPFGPKPTNVLPRPFRGVFECCLVIEFAAESHPGNRYQHNEDSLGWVEDAGVWLVADGMGGHACGDVASRIVKQSLLQGSAAVMDHSELPALPAMIFDAHTAVVAEGLRRSAENMGSTVVVVRIKGSKAEIGWCGDSRVYLWRKQQLIRLTRDHSLLEQLLESGVVDPADAFGHPQKHVLVQALGIADPEPVPAELSLDLDNGDMILLCSDGLHDEMRDDQISDLLLANPEPTDAVGALIAETLLGEALDNISVVCLRIKDIEVLQPVLSVEQLRERFERMPGQGHKRLNDDAAEPAPLGNDDFEGVAPAPRVAAATTIALPKKAALPIASSNAADISGVDDEQMKASAGKDKSGMKGFDVELLIASLALAILVALVYWLL